MVTEESDGSRS